MTTISLELIRDALKASLFPSQSNDNVCDGRDEDIDCSDGDSFHDALTEFPTDASAAILYKDDFVNASEYTKAYAEIARIFEHLNVAFAFVGQNLQESCDLINTVISKHDKRSVSLEEALEYDERHNLQYGIISCVLWLHRPLEFIIALFRSIAESTDENMSEVAKTCYLSTLGRHHAWPIQQMVSVLLLTLPTKAEMINTMQYETEAQTTACLLEVADIAQSVYDRTQKMVEKLKLK